MSSLSALKVAVDLATRQRDQARQVLLETQRIQQAGQAQLSQLTGYAEETQQRWGVRENAVLKPEVMFHQRQFQGRLEHAIGLQTDTVQGQEQRVEKARQTLLAAELRLQSLQKLVERKQQEQALAQMRREQKQTDERASLRLSIHPSGPVGQA